MTRTDFNDEQRDRASEILDQVFLDYFRAEPTTIKPFEFSTLSWKVDGPVGFGVKINISPVAKKGTKTVQPESSETYRLYAHAGRYSAFLGCVTVGVDVSQCISARNDFVEEFIQIGLKQSIDDDPNLYFRDGHPQPEVIVTPNKIRFILKLKAEQDDFPNPDVDIDASFGLAVSVEDAITIFNERKIVPVNVDVKVNVSFPWYVWLIPGAVIGLSIAINMEQDKAVQKIKASIPDIIERAILVLIQEPTGMEPHTVRIYPDGQIGVVEVTFCPLETPPGVDVG